MRSLITLLPLMIYLFSHGAMAAPAKRTASKAAAVKSTATKVDAAKTTETGVSLPPQEAQNGMDSVRPQSLDAIPDKKIAEADLNAAADLALREAAARLPNIEAKSETKETTDEKATEKTTVKTAEKSPETTTGQAVVTAKAAIDTKNLKETEIPVLANFTAKKEAVASPWTRISLSFLVIGALAGGMVFFSRWYAKRTKGVKDTNKIKVLTQHFLGPKKSLAIVRVAGETILIGVTDQNISMLKSLALLDEDIPESMPAHFEQTMVQADQRAQSQTTTSANYEPLEDFVASNIKDKVFTKLKNLRPL